MVICPLEADDAPNDWLPGGIDVEMKIAEECVITYHPVESDGLIRRKISISDLKFLIENYEYWSELSGMIKEYVYAFECTYKDGVIYNFAELPFTKD